jgi:pSer/pThr/pTyr-binding forkhead associated (FHA) protein
MLFRAGDAPRLTSAVLQVQKDGEKVESIKIGTRVSVTFGRDDSKSDVALGHQSISRVHAATVHDKMGNIQLVDCGSTHGALIQHVNCVGFLKSSIRLNAQAHLSAANALNNSFPLFSKVNSMSYILLMSAHLLSFTFDSLQTAT